MTKWEQRAQEILTEWPTLTDMDKESLLLALVDAEDLAVLEVILDIAVGATK